MNKNDTNQNLNARLLEIVRLATDYCMTCENCNVLERYEFINNMLNMLPRIYWEFNDLEGSPSFFDEDYFNNYLDEEYYESIRRHIEALMGEEDGFLETFEEDMKYSDTPIGASISESLADIFQPLFNFISEVKDSEGERIEEAFSHCKEEFCEYWSQTLCNVLRALNNVKYSNR